MIALAIRRVIYSIQDLEIFKSPFRRFAAPSLFFKEGFLRLQINQYFEMYDFFVQLNYLEFFPHRFRNIFEPVISNSFTQFLFHLLHQPETLINKGRVKLHQRGTAFDFFVSVSSG